MYNPFFSICIPVTNRERTIYNTLCSVSMQTFRDFEVIITESGSTDKSTREIDRFFESAVYKSSPFKYIYKHYQEKPKTVEDWNLPVKLASGVYIAMLEGDDQFMPDHLKTAHQFLTTHINIGLYAVGNQARKRNIVGIINNNDFVKMEITMKDPAPPSEAIFIRLNKHGEPFLYNNIEYEYAPEIDLYVRIGLDGFNAYHSNVCDVIRDITSKSWNSFHYFTDRFTHLTKYGHFLDNNIFKKEYNRNLAIAMKGMVHSFPTKISRFSREMIKKTSLWDFIRAIPLAVVDYLKYKLV